MTDGIVIDALAQPWHLNEYVRDVPRSCLCTWEWVPPLAAWMRIGIRHDCIWHHFSRNGHVPWPAEVQP